MDSYHFASELAHFNPNHDPKNGQFTSKKGHPVAKVAGKLAGLGTGLATGAAVISSSGNKALGVASKIAGKSVNAYANGAGESAIRGMRAAGKLVANTGAADVLINGALQGVLAGTVSGAAVYVGGALIGATIRTGAKIVSNVINSRKGKTPVSELT